MASDLPQLMNGLALGESPLFRLPRELRDNISDLLALSEDRLNLRILLKKGSKPQKTVFVAKGFNSVCSQLRQEYTEALERRLKLLMVGKDLAGNQLNGADGHDGHAPVAHLHISQAQGANGSSQHSHSLTLPVELFNRTRASWEQAARAQWAQATRDLVVQPLLIFTFAAESEVVEPGSHGFVECSRVRDGKLHRSLFEWPENAAFPLQQIVRTAKATDWRGSTGLFLFWHSYLLRHIPKRFKSG